MRKVLFVLSVIALAFALPCTPLYAADDAPAKPDSEKGSEKSAEKIPPPPPDVTTQGAIEVGGHHVAYTAVAGIIPVAATDAEDAQIGLDGRPLPGSQMAFQAPKEAKEAPPIAHMFYVAYFQKDAKAEDRPVTFVYNGGPGSSTVWLHMGAFGPKHVVTSGDQHLPAAPYKLVDNASSLLDATDLVFIDMPGTGFGWMTGKDNQKAFWGVDQDANAFARFIERFLVKYNRWNSPKYLFGESYGTTRSAMVADILGKSKSIDLNGVILLSQIFTFADSIDLPAGGSGGVDLPYIAALPTFAATAWYHKKLPQQPPALEPLLKDVEAFATGQYAHALAAGSDLDAPEKQQVAEKLHGYTGLPVAYLLKADLRVNGAEFEKMLQDDQDLTTGRLDTRYSGPHLNPLSEGAEYDPQSSAISSAYVALFNDYARRDLKYGEGRLYVPSAIFGDYQWISTHNGNSTELTVSTDLAEAMKLNPKLHVMVNGGYYDLATPYFAAEFEDKHLPIPKTLVKNIEYAWYESGHMVYVDDKSMKQLHDNVAAFIRKTESGQ